MAECNAFKALYPPKREALKVSRSAYHSRTPQHLSSTCVLPEQDQPTIHVKCLRACIQGATSHSSYVVICVRRFYVFLSREALKLLRETQSPKFSRFPLLTQRWAPPGRGCSSRMRSFKVWGYKRSCRASHAFISA